MNLIRRNISGKKVLFLFILTNLIYAVMLTITIPGTMEFSNGMQLLDMMPLGYDAEYIRVLFDTLGDQGRHNYLFRQIPVDMIYPGLFGITYCLLFAYFLKKLHKLSTSVFYICILPIIAGIADYLENFGIIAMLKSYPELSPMTMSSTNIFSMIKSISSTIFFVALVIVLIILGIRTLKKKTQ